jgi:predicted dehydrogenase
MVRVGIIGTGNRGIGGYGLYILREKRAVAKIVALADPDRKRLKAAQEALMVPKERVFSDAECLLDLDDIEAVIITSPDYTHREIAVKAFMRGKDVLCEKPLALTVADCDEILAAQKKSGKILCVGFCLRYNNFYRKMHDLVNKEKIIGKILMAGAIDSVSVGGQYFFHGWWRRRKYSNGLLVQKATHSIDIMNWIIGSTVDSVYGVGGLSFFGGGKPRTKTCSRCSIRKKCPEALLNRRIDYDYGTTGFSMEIEDRCVFAKEIDIFDNEILAIKYRNSVNAFFTECQFTPDYKREFIFIGEKGRMYAIDPYIMGEGVSTEPLIEIVSRYSRKRKLVKVKLNPGGHGGGDPALIDDFLNCCITRRKPLADGMAGRQSIAICAAGEKSIATGRVIKLK